MRLVALAVLIASLATVSSVSAAPFQPAPATVSTISNVDVANDPIHKPYQVREYNDDCPCSLTFPTVTDTRVVITHVSCDVVLNTGEFVYGVFLTTNADTDSNFLQMFTTPTVNSVFHAGTNSSTYLFIDKGSTPKILFLVSGGSAGGSDCTLSGYHT